MSRPFRLFGEKRRVKESNLQRILPALDSSQVGLPMPKLSSAAHPTKRRRLTPTERARAAARHFQVERACRELLALLRIECSRTDATAYRAKDGTVHRSRVDPGWPDLTACLPPTGRLLAVECKAGRDGLRQDQVDTLGRLEAAGALVVVPYTVDDLRQALERDGGPVVAARLKRLHFQS